MNVSPSKRAKGTIQVSFIIKNVRGDHLGSQCVIASVNDKSFVLKPRTIKGDTRYYEAGHTCFINVDDDEIRFGVAIVTPNNDKFFFHTFAYTDFYPSKYPTCQKLKMNTPANLYEISAQLFTMPYTRGTGSPTSNLNMTAHTMTPGRSNQANESPRDNLAQTMPVRAPSKLSQTSTPRNRSRYQMSPK
ncbi:hypothetical protein TVAG_084280 [Trichomonas vaginalis G3]|uniref:Uncharacterized protein n=1 Tax=Trichomonas vaginalis (strain ATCC PRA-98 / G3) TaxID=412133 RepID=A2G5H5_TRIV3|nr:hypothetical protein TVAGG3_0848710 [Trichomonas vaginalis G3]EAX87593.1 hypothetical protein TVAG_084280 [Trichomonas vaginalis G3]KAI5499818.1 hypothetical protein TVAGG3_0848710 [Trichomonas vaginalis G3]|eukprot:XP_001300523.1 hypothetical protein [Trichomonas vaginalis G3]